MVTFSVNPMTITEVPILSKELAKTELGMEYLGHLWLKHVCGYAEKPQKFYEVDGFMIYDSDLDDYDDMGAKQPIYDAERVDKYAKLEERNSKLKKLKYERPILDEEERSQGYKGVLEDEIAPYNEEAFEKVLDTSEYSDMLNRYKELLRVCIIREGIDISVLTIRCIENPEEPVAIPKLKKLIKKYNHLEDVLRTLLPNSQFKHDLNEIAFPDEPKLGQGAS